MVIAVVDTETISVEKRFTYNIGYVVYDLSDGKTLAKRDFVVEQIWHNRPLFETAYYANKRPKYVSAMRGRQTELSKYGYIMRKIAKDIKDFNIEGWYAFNSPFDDSVFDFNCEYYHCNNPFDTLPFLDIRGYAIEYLADGNYKDFCLANGNICGADGKSKFLTDSDGFKTTAESFYCYLTNQTEFNEEHTALADSEIELEILLECLKRGATIQTEYKVPKSLPRNTQKKLYIKRDGKVIAEFDYVSKTERKVADGLSVSLKN